MLYRLPYLLSFILILVVAGCQFGGPDPEMEKGECSVDFPQGICEPGKFCMDGKCYKESPNCSRKFPNGVCYDGKTCYKGECVKDIEPCSADHPEGICDGDYSCIAGTCIKKDYPCSPEHLDGTCEFGKSCIAGACVSEDNQCSPANPTGLCQQNYTCEDGTCIANTIDLGDFGTFTGTFAQKQYLPSNNKSFGLNTFTKTHMYHLVQLKQNPDNTITSTEELCYLEAEVDNPMGGTEFSEAYINYTKPAQLTFHFKPKGRDILVEHPEVTEVNGAEMPDLSAPLPTDENDERVRDQDQDSKPGMTLNVLVMGSKVEIYVVDRAKKTRQGKILDASSFGGTLTWSEEQSILGSDNPAFANSTLEINAVEGTFKYVKIPSDWDCVKIKENKDTLFGIEE